MNCLKCGSLVAEPGDEFCLQCVRTAAVELTKSDNPETVALAEHALAIINEEIRLRETVAASGIPGVLYMGSSIEGESLEQQRIRNVIAARDKGHLPGIEPFTTIQVDLGDKIVTIAGDGSIS